MTTIRRRIGNIFLFMGVGILLTSMMNGRSLWHGVVIEKKLIERPIEKKEIVYTAPPEDAERALAYTGKLITKETGEATITRRWHYIRDGCEEKDPTGWLCTPSGDYQFLTKDNEVLMLTFCDPVPDIKVGSVVNVSYLLPTDHTKECNMFLKAKVIKGASR